MDITGLSELGKLIATVGLPGAITALAFFYGLRYMKEVANQAAVREQRMADRIDKLEDGYRNEMVGLIQGTHEALDHNTDAIRDLQRTVAAQQESTSKLVHQLVEQNMHLRSSVELPKKDKPPHG